MIARERRTKIVATLGPATHSPKGIRSIIEAGVDVIRINFSHGSSEQWLDSFKQIRRISDELGRAVGILCDLQGPKIRIGSFEGEPRPVKENESIRIAVNRTPKENEFPCDYSLLDQDAQVGDSLLIDDGNIGATITKVEKGTVTCRILNDGYIAQRKGINLPDSVVSAPALTEKDIRDAKFAAEYDADLIALSFVRRKEDVLELRGLLEDAGKDIPVVSKIEKPQAIENLEEILTVSWGVMVARGDLGVELSPEDVPMAQKRIIQKANQMAKPVVTATQMLDSMTRQPRPTRAEASDVANAVLDGTDAVMLSGETAMGRYPVETVEMMDRIIQATESHSKGLNRERRIGEGLLSDPEAVADAACKVARGINARAVAAFTRTGATAIMVSERRPNTPLLAFTPVVATRNRLTLVWGVLPVHLTPAETVEERVRRLDELLVTEDMVQQGEPVVLTMAAPGSPAGSTNIMLIHHIGEHVPATLQLR